MDKFHKQIDFSTVLFIVYFPSCNDLKIEIKKKKGDICVPCDFQKISWSAMLEFDLLYS